MFVDAEDLDKVDVFRGINEFARKFIAAHTKIVTFNPGIIMKKGVAPGSCYFILDGICHVRNEEPNTTSKSSTHGIERHQGFRGVGDSIGITSALAHYAHQSRARQNLGSSKEIAREHYETFLGVGLNSANTYAVTPCQLLFCDQDTLLTAVQICPFLVSNIARAISLRMQQDTLLQQRAALKPLDCLPLLAQFLHEWHMVVSAYKNLGSGKSYQALAFSHKQLQDWLRIGDESAIASAIRFLQMKTEAINVLAATKRITQEDAITFRALSDDEATLLDARALLLWCKETQSRELIVAEQEKRPKRPKDASSRPEG